MRAHVLLMALFFLACSSLQAATATRLVIPGCGIWPPLPPAGGCGDGQVIIPLGTPVTVEVVAIDDNDAVATGYTGTVQITSSDPTASLPAPHTFTSADGSRFTFWITFNSPGAGWTQEVVATDTRNSLQASAFFHVMPAQLQSISPVPVLSARLLMLLCSAVAALGLARLAQAKLAR